MSHPGNNQHSSNTETPHDFDSLLDSILTAKTAVASQGLEQRLLARLMLSAEAEKRATSALFTTSARMTPQRSAATAWTAIGLHAVVILLIAFGIARHVQITAPAQKVAVALLPPVPPPLAPRHDTIGGGGGHHDLSPVTQGHLPKLAQTQIVPPKAPPTIAPKLAVEPAVVVQRDLKMADMKAPEIGAPNSMLKGFALGTGNGPGMGNGSGAGIGPGSGGNSGSGVFHVGGGVHAPAVLREVEPEFSEEARKAKFSGNVLVYLIVNEQGAPEHVRCLRDIGMGLCDKAVEAVQQYKFKPATKDGKPVKVDMNVDVNFNIF